MIVPDSITPVVGWKSWKVDDGFLASPMYPLTWPIGERAEAVCRQSSGDNPFVSWANWQIMFDPPRRYWAAVDRAGTEFKLAWDGAEKPAIELPYGWRIEQRVEGPKHSPYRHAQHGDTTPDEKCACGIYASTILEAKRYENTVIGRIEGWGRVIEGDFGFRSQYAYPKDIYLVGVGWRARRKLARELSFYGVPVHTVSCAAEAQAIAGRA